MKNLIYIFSKDRACQLETLLNSLNNFIDTDIEILYTTSNEKYKDGYNILIQEYPSIKWTYQDNATKQFFSSIKNYDVVGIFTDDCVIFDKTPQINMNGVGCFSLRLGLNTIVQDHFAGTYQPILDRYIDEDETIKWNTEDYNPIHNYGYTFGCDGCFYNTRFLEKIIDFTFNNPPQLEQNLFSKRKLANPWIRSPKYSCLVNVPLTASNSGFTRSMGVDQNMMNENFLIGKRLRYDKQKIVGAHQNLSWKLII